MIIRGFQVDDTRIGPTPCHWKDRPKASPTLAADICFFLCSSLLGDPVGWATQQAGRIMHDIMPIAGHEREQLGSGSEDPLSWHTEDAFHPLRADYLGLMCLRNPDRVPTTFASVQDLELPAEVTAVLREPRFPIRPDRSHLPVNLGNAGEIPLSREIIQRSYGWITRLDEQPDRVSVLFGDSRSPYLRIDPYFMDGTADSEAATALNAIRAEIDRVLTAYPLSPGEIVLVDNYRVVHGRVPFKARFDGTDRWLKRLNIVRDLRKSRDRRLAAGERVIF